MDVTFPYGDETVIEIVCVGCAGPDLRPLTGLVSGLVNSIKTA